MRKLGGRYWLREPLGHGGMAVVWRAYDSVLRRPVAVKVLAPGLADDAQSRERIRAEAYAAAQLSHPNVANVYDFGESHLDTTEKVPYIVMELVEGETLAARLRRGPVPHWRTAVRICSEVAAALAAAHASGVVHRDVKPGNIMLASTGVKVVDFGIAEAVGDRQADRRGVLLGTPTYLAPERMRGEPVVPATDTYALGLLLYHCLTGTLPWQAATPAEMMSAHRDLPPAPLPAIPGLPPEVGELCERCLSKEPSERPTSLLTALVLAEAIGAQVTLPSLETPTASAKPVSVEPVESMTTVPMGRSRLRAPTSFKRTGVLFEPLPRHAPPRRFRSRHAAGVAAVVVALASLIAMPLLTNSTTQNVMMPGSMTDPRETRGGSGGCTADYQTREHGDGSFSANLTVVNTGTEALDTWSLRFSFPSGQQLTGARGARWTQIGSMVTLNAEQQLGSGHAAQLVLVGRYVGRTTAPEKFTLDGMDCESTAQRAGSQLTPAADAADGGVDRGGRGSLVGNPATPNATRGETPARTPAPSTPPDPSPSDPSPSDPSPSVPSTPSPSSSSPSPSSPSPSGEADSSRSAPSTTSSRSQQSSETPSTSTAPPAASGVPAAVDSPRLG